MRGKTNSERLVAAALAAQIGPHDQVLTSVRFSDPAAGDVEVDFVVLLQGFGIAIVEVKGGQIEYNDAQWTLNDGNRTRRINPIEQARRGKHALRRYLDRQPSWQYGMPNSEWFLVFPFTKVNGDLGPEGRRDLIIANGELDSLVTRMRATLAASNKNEHKLDESSLPAATELLLGKSAGEIKQPAYMRWMPSVFAAAVGVVGGVLIHSAFHNWVIDLSAAAMVGIGLGLTNKTFLPRLNQRALLSAAAAVGLVVGGLVADSANFVTPFADCDPNYGGCIPVSGDVDCSDLNSAIQVTGIDIYQLDRDGDGIACETLDPAN